MKRLSLFIAAVLAVSSVFAQKKPMKEFVNELMAKMTLEEKIGQLNLLPGGDVTTGAIMDSPLAQLTAAGQLGAVLNVKGQDKIHELQRVAVKKSRLGIPLLIGLDVIHGNQTVFPIPLAQACSWNLKAIENGARIAAKEATAQGVNWVYSPMVDIAIDPRWGRVAEGAGEDPFLGCRIGEALVKGYQGCYGKENAMACVKHFALYGAAEAGRDYNTVDMSRVRMYNQYLAPYKAAAEAGAGSFMSSFNVVDGVPATCNKWLLTDLLRKEWKYDGFVVTDYGSINEAIVHGIGDQSVTSELALKAGTDMDMCSSAFIKQLANLVKNGRVSQEDIDTACRRVLEAKYKLGLFDDPYRFCEPKRLKTDLYTAEHRKAARDMAAETFVLLKNDGVLPLKKQGKIALIGPLGNNRSNMVGCWSTADTPELYSTLKEAMERAVGDKAQVMFAQGCNIYADENIQKGATFGRPIDRVDDDKAKEEALRVAADADIIVCAMGEMAEMSGESSSRTDISLPRVQMELLKDLVATGKPVVMLNFAGRPTVMAWEAEHVNAILNVWFGGSEAGDAICDVLFGDKNPSGHLTMTMPKALGQIPIYYNHLNTGRPVPEGVTEYRKYQSNYIDVRNDPLYPFGYGMSYTTFEYGKPRLNATTMKADGSITLTVNVRNSGNRDGDEVVQLYIHDMVATIARPVKELKGFERISLKAGESRDVTFTINADMLKFYNSNLQYVAEPGDFEAMVGGNSRDVQKIRFTLQ
ncbi:MAG: beta-glucosidase BglX [Prevotellaceae bacterium]|nr:beta-glucosidase BglX [Prevotellaceae bacterium]MDY6199813.1 beta-glucosidase BglX [Prevotella sp.]